MKLEKAIDRNIELKGELVTEGRLEKAEAVQLDIEALEAINEWRIDKNDENLIQLPSETKD